LASSRKEGSIEGKGGGGEDEDEDKDELMGKE
jgi:hypothetical protein